MSNENNKRPNRDELDIDRLIRSIRSGESQPQEAQPVSPPAEPVPTPEPQAVAAVPEAPVVVPTRSGRRTVSPAHPPQPQEKQQPQGVEEEASLEVQQMCRQIASAFSASSLDQTPVPEQTAPAEEPPAPSGHWQLPKIPFPVLNREPAETAEAPVPAEPESPQPQEQPPQETSPKRAKPHFHLPFFHGKPKAPQEEAREPSPVSSLPQEDEPVSAVWEQPEPPEPPQDTAPEAQSLESPEPDAAQAQPGEPEPVDQPEPSPAAAPADPQPSRPTAQEQERQAFAAGQVITLNLRRSVSAPNASPSAFFDQEAPVAQDEIPPARPAQPREDFPQENTQPEPAPQEPVPQQDFPPEDILREPAPQESVPQPDFPPEDILPEPVPQEPVPQPDFPPEDILPEPAPQEPVPQPEEPVADALPEPAPDEASKGSGHASVRFMTVSLRHSDARRASSESSLFDQEDAQLEALLFNHSQARQKTLEEEAMEEEITLPKLDYTPVLLRTEPARPAQPPEPDQPEEEDPAPQPSEPQTQEPPRSPEKEPEQPVKPVRSFDFPEDSEDAELESMLSAHAGPVQRRFRPEVVTPLPKRPQVPEEDPAGETTLEEPAPAEPAAQASPAEPAPEQAKPASPSPKTAKPQPPREEDDLEPEDWEDDEEEEDEDGLPDESLLERPKRQPGLLLQLVGFAASLLQPRPKETTQPEPTEGDGSPSEEPPVSPASRKPKARKPAHTSAQNVIELPQEKPNLLRQKWEEMEERANSFADSMFQGDSPEFAEEEAQYEKAERYIPGTDEERTPPPRRRKPRPEPKPKEPIRRAPDTSPKELTRIFHSSWKSGKGRLPFQLILALLLILLGTLAEGELPLVSLPVLAENLRLSGILLTVGLAGACILGLDTLLEGFFQLFRGKPGLNTLSSIGVLMTLIDGVWYSILIREGPLPFCGFAALSLWAVAWGNCRKKQGLYLSCQTVAAMSHPQRLTLDQGKWDNKGTFIKETGSAKGFGSQIQEPDGAQRVYHYAAPVMMIACLIFGILAAVGQKSPQQLIWNWSVIFVLATPLSATLAYGVPYIKLVKRLNRAGVVLAGWEGVDSMKGEAGIAITDSDLFPEGYVQFNGIKNFGQVSLEKLTGCTASMLREMDTGLAKIFDDQIRTQGGFYRRVDELKAAEGGFSGLIRGDQVLVGCADYMNLMSIPLKQGYQVRNAVFCVINGQLQGIFALNYALPNNVKPALSALIHGGVNPILATRDFNITPTMLRQRFRLPTERMEYPPVDRRHLLSARGQPHNPILGALIYREGLGACTDAILGGRRLRTVVRLNTILSVAASVVGALLGFYLAMMGAYYSLSPLNILFFLVMWLIPTLLISHGVDKF